MDGKDYKFLPNSAIDDELQRMLGMFDATSQQRLSRVLKQKNRSALKNRDEVTDAHARNVFREIVPAYTLNRAGCSFEYEKQFGDLTPDWFDQRNSIILECYTFQRGATSEFAIRTRSALEKKHNRYASIVSAQNARLLICVYLDFLAPVDLELAFEHSENITNWLTEFQSLWGILFYAEKQHDSLSELLANANPSVDNNCTFDFYCRDDYWETVTGWPFPNRMVR
jgi:hypothetical protein